MDYDFLKYLTTCLAFHRLVRILHVLPINDFLFNPFIIFYCSDRENRVKNLYITFGWAKEEKFKCIGEKKKPRMKVRNNETAYKGRHLNRNWDTQYLI